MALVRARRQAEVFDIAIVAVVTKALGAFIALVIILMPYYRSDPANAPAVNVVTDQLRQATAAVAMAERALASPTLDRPELQRRIMQVKEAISEAQKLVQGLRSKLDQASSQIKTMSEQAARDKSRIAELEQQSAQMRASIERMTQQAATLQREAQTMRAEAEAARNQARQAESRLQQQSRDLAERSRQIEDLREQLRGAQMQVAALEKENLELKATIEDLRRRITLATDPSVVMRWLTVGLIIPDCPDVEFALYARWTGPLVNGASGNEMPNQAFDASDPAQRTTLLGQRYFALGARGDDNPIGDKALRQSGMTGLGRTQILTFHTVSAVPGGYGVYVAAANPAALGNRRCAVHPYFQAWSGATLGDRVVLSGETPFAWLREFEIKSDGKTTIPNPPARDSEFRARLARFSNEQAQKLCRERNLCNREDAHHALLRGQTKSKQ